jgi:cytochrome c-type biogenesis protein
MESVSIGLAFVAGLVSFVSPCVLALLPVYLAYLGQAAAVDGPGGATAVASTRAEVLPQALLFVLGFSAVFVLLGTSLGLLGRALFGVPEVRQVAGLAVIALGVVTTGVFGPITGRLRIGVDPTLLPTARRARSFALGGLVSIGWTPCIGPVLGSILMGGGSSGSAAVSTLLLVAYSAGLAVPFLVAAVALPRLQPLIGVLRRHHRSVEVASGLLIAVIGVLIYLNAFARLAGLFRFVL